MLASNQSTIVGGWDEDELAKVLADLAAGEQGLEGIGFSQEDVDELLRRAGDENRVVTQDDEQDVLERAAELQQKWQTAVGQIWASIDLPNPEEYARKAREGR